MNNYELKRQAKKDRLLNAAKKAEIKSRDLWQAYEKSAAVIPMGQPINSILNFLKKIREAQN